MNPRSLSFDSSFNNPAKPVNFRDIAREAGVSPAAVSLALRDSPQISAPVRQKIREVAKRMGYRPNPLLAAYQASVRSRKPVKFQAVLGWINDNPDEKAWTRPWSKPMLDGARARAGVLGFQLDEIWVPETKIEDPADNARRWQKVMRARGIYGVILPAIYHPQHGVLLWEGFGVVCVGRHQIVVEKSIRPMKEIHEHHRVNSDYFSNMRLAFSQLKKAGCKRIGLAISSYHDNETDHAYSAAFLRDSMDMPKKDQIPLLIETNVVGAVGAWVSQYKPDAVICSHSEMLDAIRKLGLKVPGDLRVAHLNVASDVADWSGIDRRLAYVGSAAVDMLSAHLMRNESGVPPYAKETMIEGVWMEGKT